MFHLCDEDPLLWIAAGMRRLAPGPVVAEDFRLGLSNQFVEWPTAELGGGWIGEGRLALRIQPANAFARRIQDQLIASLQLLQLFGARLDMHLQHCLRAFQRLPFMRPILLRLLESAELRLQHTIGGLQTACPLLGLRPQALQLFRVPSAVSKLSS